MSFEIYSDEEFEVETHNTGEKKLYPMKGAIYNHDRKTAWEGIWKL